MKAAILLVVFAAFLAIEHVSADQPKVIHLTHKPPPIDAPNPRAAMPTLHTIIMKVDNFNNADTRTWNMRYYANPQHFRPGGPIFIYLGGEWEMDAGALQGGQIYDMAAEHGGHMYNIEHRYYGRSWPTNDLSTPNLKYLSVDQALADVAAFIRQMKSKPNLANSKVVVVGGSYSGTMATWGRMIYPDLIDASYASSAPLLALDDFQQYFEIVGKNINLESPQCWDVISEATADMDNLFNTPAGRQALDSIFNTCQPLPAGFPYKDQIFNQIANHFAGVVQYAQAGDIKATCDKLMQNPGTSTQKLAAFISSNNNGACMGNYDDAMLLYKQTNLDPKSMYRQWFYQTCSGLGFFQTGNSTQQPFGRTWFSTLSHKMCKEAFGPAFSKNNILKAIDATNAKYGGMQPQVSKVVFIHGTVDPWHAIGLLNSLHDEAPAILVQGTSHGADLSSISWSDSQEMSNAKQAAKDYIAKWIS